jgi:hypothetical protein
MAVLAPYIVDEMGAGIVFGSFDLMAPMAGDLLGLDSTPSCGVLLDIGDIPVTAVAGIGPVDRFGEFGYVDVPMALQAGRVVDTLQAVLSSPDLELLLGHLDFLVEFQFLCGTDRSGDEKAREEQER